MISGARIGQPSWLRRLVARAEGHVLTAFVVPGAAIARAHSLDLAAAGLSIAPSPRHANVLVIVGELLEGLVQPTAVAYAQMARPRAILSIGAARLASLPAPDVTVALDQTALVGAVADLRRRFAAGAWTEDTDAFAFAGDQPPRAMDHGGHDHHMMHHGMHGGMAMTGDEQHVTAPHEDAPGEPPDMPMDRAMHHPTGAEATPDAPMTHGDHGRDHPADSAPPTDDPHRAMHSDMAMDPSAHGTMGKPGDHAMDADPHRGTHMAMSHDMHGGEMQMPMVSPTEDETHHDMTTPTDDGGHRHPDAAMGHDMPHGATQMPANHDDGDGHDMHGDMDMPMDHSGHAGMDMDMSGGFMSMVAMTQGLPRSRDGLPMEWAEAPFGPLFPGLPGGLALALTLDGDTAAEANTTPGMVHRELAATWPGPAARFPDQLALLDPQTPVAYRVLASRALEDAAAFTINEAMARQRLGALERERAVSHLSWLADFAMLLGDRWLAGRAEELQFALMRATDDPSVSRVGREIAAFVRRVGRTPFLKRRLDGVGHDASHAAEKIGGPFARARGLSVDARRDDPTYRDLGFAPVTHDGNDAWARLRVRLGELTQSMELIRAVGTATLPDPFALTTGSGTGKATVETPRGPATLHIALRDVEVVEVHLDTPSDRLIHLVPDMAEGRELADALIGIASLDLSPWEIDR